MSEMRIDARWDFSSQLVEIRLLEQHGDKTYGGQLTMLPVREGYPVPTSLTLRAKESQQLMDQLWQCGLRPTEGTGSAGALAAVEKHLADMRMIAFSELGIDE